MLGNRNKAPTLATLDKTEARTLPAKEVERIDKNRMEASRKRRDRERAERSKPYAVRRNARSTEDIAAEARLQIAESRRRDEEE